ncbi:MAG: NAD(P)H-binding protein [Bauldia sp.]|nr:NAD(P)H-binding protein [Bauldia sp.]
MVAQGLARGHEVTAFVRDPARAAAKLPKGARVVRGDARSAADVAAAVAESDTVFIAIGDRNVLVSADAVRNAVAAMQVSGARRIIVVSAYGAGDSGHGLQGFVFRRLLTKLNADKMAAEQALSDSGLDWTAVRAVTLSDKPATGKAKAAVDVTVNGFRPVSRADLAAFMLDEMDRNAFVRQRPIFFAA